MKKSILSWSCCCESILAVDAGAQVIVIVNASVKARAVSKDDERRLTVTRPRSKTGSKVGAVCSKTGRRMRSF